VHDEPDEERLQEFSQLATTYGIEVGDLTRRENVVRMLEILAKHPQGYNLRTQFLRSLKKACYRSSADGHYGLHKKDYTHFTSPIRRYADLMVHRLLFQYIEKKGKFKYSLEGLEEISDHISVTERNAVDAERQSVKLKQVEYLQNHIGDEFHAIISGVAHFGIFVKVTDILAEGLVKLRDLESDYYIYDEKKYALVGRATKKQFRLGDKIHVKLIRVDLEKSELDFIILE